METSILDNDHLDGAYMRQCDRVATLLGYMTVSEVVEHLEGEGISRSDITLIIAGAKMVLDAEPKV